ncbi:flagellar hook-associated protein FlgK [Aliigemmobacter aestuarii]|uniref:Flagellar hook-associated protein 1 n=1 Tax=Aliigemmobacter aestuarii TaxID=1445661 RepID=A0A4S3MSR7_9RHOB|nr:flagellar hook-associated protein FlgK [Gemmobacter aestuarii]THD85636.1 flagellar hook-associated protein FlgK [Gemmobacter aestuarii]
MTISATLSSALSGLQAASRAAELISSNVANAMTEGYARRELELAARRVGDSGQGVSITGVNRLTDPALTSDRRMAESDLAGGSEIADFLSGLLDAIGNAEDAGSLSAGIGRLDAALVTAAANPGSNAHLAQVLDAARAVADGISRIGRSIQTARNAADNRISADVATVNQTLARIADLNTEIRGQSSAGRDPSALMDQRSQMVDRLAGLLPLRVVDRDHGQIAIYTTSGAVLLDGRPSVLGFTRAAMVTPEMTMASGGLSGLTLNGVPMTPGTQGSLVNGGALGARFEIRDRLGPQAQARIDAIARDLMERTADPAVDPTLAPGAPGLFTDLGATFDPLTEAGLAQRLRINAAVDPLAGGAIWRLRDGIGAAAPGPPGDPSRLAALRGALSDPRLALSADLAAGATSATGLAGAFLSLAATEYGQADLKSTYLSSRHSGMKALELQNGVDTDQEMQALLLVEQAYAANARLIQTVDDMIQTLLGI